MTRNDVIAPIANTTHFSNSVRWRDRSNRNFSQSRLSVGGVVSESIARPASSFISNLIKARFNRVADYMSNSCHGILRSFQIERKRRHKGGRRVPTRRKGKPARNPQRQKAAARRTLIPGSTRI